MNNLLYYLTTTDCLKIWKDKMVIMSSYTNLMFIADIEQHEIQKVVEIDEENIRGLFRNCIIYQDVAYLIPFNAKRFWKVELNSGVAQAIDSGEKIYNKILKAFMWKGQIWCLRDGSELIYIDLNNIENDGYTVRIKYVDKEIQWIDTFFCCDDGVWTSSRANNIVYFIEPDIEKISEIILKFEIGKILDIAFVNDKVFLYDVNGNEYVATCEGKLLQKREKIPTSMQSVLVGGKQIRLGTDGDSIYIKNMFTQKEEKLDIPVHRQFNGKKKHFHYAEFGKDYFWIQARYGEIFAVSLADYVIRSMELSIDKKLAFNKYYGKIIQGDLLDEQAYDGTFGLMDYISLIKNLDED